MAMTFTVALTCRKCKASLRFEDERPAWKTYDYRVEHAEECEKSARFVAEHADDPLPGIGEQWTAYEDAGCPPYVSVWSKDWSVPERKLTLAIPDAYRYIECPVCDAQIREPKP